MSQSASLIAQAQAFLRGPACPADAWLLYDYRGLNPFFWQVLGPVPNVTRPCWCLVPRRGRARLLTHHVDAGRFAGTGLPVDSFSSNEQMSAALRRLLRGKKQVAMEYAPNGSLPRVSRVDAGTVELVRSLGVEVVSSADLVQHVTQRWSPAQLASHKRAAEKVSQVVQEAFTHIGINLMAEITEGDAAEFIRRRFRGAGDGRRRRPGGCGQRPCRRPALRPRSGGRHHQARRLGAHRPVGQGVTRRRRVRRHHVGGLRWVPGPAAPARACSTW